MINKTTIIIVASVLLLIGVFFFGKSCGTIDISDELKQKEAKVIELQKENDMLRIDLDTVLDTSKKYAEELDTLYKERTSIETGIIEKKDELKDIECPKSIKETVDRLKALGLTPKVRCN